MASARPWIGFGPEAFSAQFPQFQSRELARSYPDFYYESPHNMLLDALTETGIAGLLIVAGFVVIGVRSGLRGPPGLLAGLVSTVLAQQFLVLIAPTTFFFFLGIGLLALGADRAAPFSIQSRARPSPVLYCSILASCALVFVVFQMTVADLALGSAKRLLDAGDTFGAMDAYQKAGRFRASGVTADLYFSRRWAAGANTSPDALSKFGLGQLALEAGRRATEYPEQSQNALYNLAILAAAAGSAQAVEADLRAAIRASPNWFKPHWSLARLLYSTGRIGEARQEARLALDLDAGKDPEVVATTAEILRSTSSLP
jgi:tetratricopeptide (TPR) repeat protein